MENALNQSQQRVRASEWTDDFIIFMYAQGNHTSGTCQMPVSLSVFMYATSLSSTTVRTRRGMHERCDEAVRQARSGVGWHDVVSGCLAGCPNNSSCVPVGSSATCPIGVSNSLCLHARYSYLPLCLYCVRIRIHSRYTES